MAIENSRGEGDSRRDKPSVGGRQDFAQSENHSPQQGIDKEVAMKKAGGLRTRLERFLKDQKEQFLVDNPESQGSEYFFEIMGLKEGWDVHSTTPFTPQDCISVHGEAPNSDFWITKMSREARGKLARGERTAVTSFKLCADGNIAGFNDENSLHRIGNTTRMSVKPSSRRDGLSAEEQASNDELQSMGGAIVEMLIKCGRLVEMSEPIRQRRGGRE